MPDAFYTFITFIGRRIFWLSERPTLLYIDRLSRPGPFIIAANHQSPYDVALLMRHSPRHLDFVSIKEVFAKPLLGWFYGHMNAFPLDRSRPDGPTVRTILDRLSHGRAVAMFPEGRLTKLQDSVVTGGRIRPGIARIAQLAGAPVIPVAIYNSEAYSRPKAWLPLRRTRYGIHVGEPLTIPSDLEKAEAAKLLEEDLKSALIRLHAELRQAMDAKSRRRTRNA